MPDTVVKRIELAKPAVTEPVQRKLGDPLWPRPNTRIPIAKALLADKPDIGTELAEVRKAWRIYRSTNSRDAVYIYLARVFAVVSQWQRLECALKKARAALRLRANAPQMKPEPFAIVIFCTSDANVVDDKMRSKWSRALRYAVRAKPPGQRLADFVMVCGGLNECARRFAQNR